MSTQITNDAVSDQPNAKPPGQRMMGAGPIALVALYLIALSLLDLYGLVKLWPYPTPSGEPRTKQQRVHHPHPLQQHRLRLRLHLRLPQRAHLRQQL